MNASKIVLRKPSVSEILDQITPFVTDEKHEQEFALRFQERVCLAKEICSTASIKRLNADLLIELLRKNDQTINVLLSLLGVSQEEFFRHVTLARLIKHKLDQNATKFSEWKMNKIISVIKGDNTFANAVFDLILNGSANAELVGRVPAFLVAKLDGARLASIGDGGIDSLIRTGLKGAYDSKKGKPVVDEVELLLEGLGVEYRVGELTIPKISRKFDAAIPNVSSPHILIEVGVFATTARELSEKGVFELSLKREATEYSPDCVIVRELDGEGWIARGGTALANVIAASDYVFTQKTLIGLQKVVRAHVPRRYFRTSSHLAKK